MTGADLTCLTSRTQGGYRTADDKLYASMSEDADVEDANKAEVLRVRIQFEHSQDDALFILKNRSFFV